MSGSSRLWPEPDKGASTEGTRGMTEGTVGGLIKGGTGEWKGKIGERRSPFVRHAPLAFLCSCHSFQRANPAARLRVSVSNTYSVIIIHLALSAEACAPLPRSVPGRSAPVPPGAPGARTSGVEEKRVFCTPFLLPRVVIVIIFYTFLSRPKRESTLTSDI